VGRYPRPVRSAPVLIVSGPPGSGKSTVAPLVARRCASAVCLESDWFWTTIASGHVTPWLAEADAQNRTVLRAWAAAAAVFAQGGYTVVMNGIVGPWSLDLVSREVARVGADVHYVVLRPSLDVALTRATQRAPLTPGNVPLTEEGPIRQLWEQFQNLGTLEAHVIDTTTHSPEETAEMVWTRFATGSDLLPTGQPIQ
jgi:predicted kinase